MGCFYFSVLYIDTSCLFYHAYCTFFWRDVFFFFFFFFSFELLNLISLYVLRRTLDTRLQIKYFAPRIKTIIVRKFMHKIITKLIRFKNNWVTFQLYIEISPACNKLFIAVIGKSQSEPNECTKVHRRRLLKILVHTRTLTIMSLCVWNY